MTSPGKGLSPDEAARLRAGLKEVQREVRELIEFLQTKLKPKEA
jgi:hypothetical protein